MEWQLVQNSVVETAASPPNTTATITTPKSVPTRRALPVFMPAMSVFRTFHAHLGAGLEFVVVLELRISSEDAIELVVLVHGLGILDVLVKVEGVFLVHFRGEGGVGFLRALPGAALVVHVAGVAAFFEAEVLTSIGQYLAGGGLLRFFISGAGFAVGAAILGAGSMAGFAAYPGQELARVVNRVAAFLAPAIHVTADTVLVLGVVLGRIELGLLLGFCLGIGLQGVHGLGVRSAAPGFSLALVTGTAFLAAFKRFGSRCAGHDRKQCCCGQGECHAMVHPSSFFLSASISVVSVISAWILVSLLTSCDYNLIPYPVFHCSLLLFFFYCLSLLL